LIDTGFGPPEAVGFIDARIAVSGGDAIKL